jgi:hypothetical protein
MWVFSEGKKSHCESEVIGSWEMSSDTTILSASTLCVHSRTLTLELGLVQWTDPKDLHGVGQYGSDAYRIFCRGDWRDVNPADKDLAKYHAWLVATNGEGTGLERDHAVDDCPRT